MTDTNSQPGCRDVDARLAAAMVDDLPEEVEKRLERSVDAHLAQRRRAVGWIRTLLDLLGESLWPRPLALVLSRLVVPAAFVLLASGALLGLEGGVATGTSPVPRLSATVTLSRAIEGAGSLLCSADSDLVDVSPHALARRVYRDWVLVRSERRGPSEMRLTFRALDEPALYEMDVEKGSFRPQRLRRVEAAGIQRGRGVVEDCEWAEPGESSEPGADGRSR